MVLIHLLKPDFLYNHKENKYRNFGNNEDETFLSIHVVAIILAILLILFFQLNSKKNNQNIIETDDNVNDQIKNLQSQINQLINIQLTQSHINNVLTYK